MTLDKSQRPESGFTLVEMAVVIAIAGVLMVMAAGFAIPLINTGHSLATQEKMNKVTLALAAYAVRNDRLPCPGVPNTASAAPSPFGYERNSNAGDALGNCVGANVGMVPFRTLGLPEDTVIDGWGNPFTYAVSPVFTQDTSTNLQVHPSCRTAGWLYQDGNVYRNRNPDKARFCCPGAFAGDVIVQDSAGNAVVNPVRSAANSPSATAPAGSICQRIQTGPAPPAPPAPYVAPVFPCAGTDCCTGYATADTPFSTYPNTSVPPTDKPTAVAYVLVSHGANSVGAYDLNTGATLPGAAGWENNNVNGPYRDITPTDAGQTYDDVLIWRTQDTVFSDAGESCAAP